MFQEINAADTLSQLDSLQDRYSTSTSTTSSECSSPCDPFLVRNILTNRCDQRLHIFRSSKTDGEISQKLIQKAVSWIEITGFTKNLQFETIVLTISLFYASLNNIVIQKKNLQATICSCLLLACKMTSRAPLTMADVLSLIDNRQNAKTILEHQKKILLALDFNLHFEFPILELIFNQLKQQQHQQKAKFLVEVLLLKQSAILYDFEKMEQIMQLCQKSRLGNSSKLAIKISKILKKNSGQHLISKYQAKFNVNNYITQDDIVSNYI